MQSQLEKNKTKKRQDNSRNRRPPSLAASLISFTTIMASVATTIGALSGLQFPQSQSLLPSQGPVQSCLLLNPITTSNTTVPTSSLLDGNTKPETPPCETDDSGALDAYRADGRALGSCALKHTRVDAKVSGYTSRVTVTQVFRNPFKEKIEARYRFPLSQDGAVDEMNMRIGDRVIKGDIKRREEAAQIYETAKNNGQVASLLDQERTNIFTQSIANLEPGKEVEITIKYTEVLAYRNGGFQFVFPTVVGPRFDPYTGTAGGSPANSSTSESSNSNSWLNPIPGPSTATNTAATGTRSGHDISINVSIDEGMAIQKLTSPLHGIMAQQVNTNKAFVSLKQAATIPNRDFVLDIQVAAAGLKTGYVATRKNAESGYATFMVMPPKAVTPKNIAPRELVFIVDCSGSQGGAPIEKSKETLKYVIDHVNDNDSFQIIAFNSTVQTLFEKPETLTISRKIQAKYFVDNIHALGGTWMAPAVEAACAIPADEHRLRIVSFMTDGYVGNDYEVIGLVKKLRGTSRWFPFGIGDSVNRTLIEGIAREGGGEPEFVLLNSKTDEIASKFYDRIKAPVFTDVKLTMDGVELHDVYPRSFSDVWDQKPLFFKARYTKPGAGKVIVNGFAAGKPYRQIIDVNLPAHDESNAQVAQIWARAKIDELMSQDWEGAQTGVMSEHVKEEIVKTALAHHLLSQFTSFVAVDKSRTTSGYGATTVDVAGEMPEGVGKETQKIATAPSTVSLNTTTATPAPTGNPAMDKLNRNVDRAFKNVVNQLNSLSCAAGCASGGSSYGSYAATSYTPPKSAEEIKDGLNAGDIALLIIGFVPAPLRAVLIVLLTTLAALRFQRVARQVAENEGALEQQRNAQILRDASVNDTETSANDADGTDVTPASVGATHVVARDAENDEDQDAPVEFDEKNLQVALTLFIFAALLAIGNWNLLHYPGA